MQASLSKNNAHKLKEKLDYHYSAFDKSRLSPDPLEFPHKFSKACDIECAAFISSIFAYGSVTQINNTLKKIFEIFGSHPYNYLTNTSGSGIKNDFKNINHRFYTSEDVSSLFTVLGKMLNEYGTLRELAVKYCNGKNGIKEIIGCFCSKLLNEFAIITPGVRFMFPLPEKGSACKRMNLFLRWMVRKDELDFGLWSEIPASCLIIPVDTHIAKISKSLKLTERKNVSWEMAAEITANLKKFDPDDPVKYDFALCHIGMRKLKF